MKRTNERSSGKVLVLGNDNRSFLTVIRSLGRQGIRIHVGWCDANPPALSSKYIEKVHDIPRYCFEDNAWKESLSSILRQENYDLVIPCDDPSLLPIQKHRQEFEKISRIYLLNDYAFQITFNKYKTAELARELGISVPQEFQITKLNEAKTILAKMCFPVVIKPLFSFTLVDLQNRNQVHKAYSYQEAESLLKFMLQQGKVLVQENFIGRGVGVEVLVKNGEVLTAFQHLRIHEPLFGGGSSYRKSTPLHPDLLSAVQRLMKALHYTGVAMVEFKVDFTTGSWILIEINGRFWGSLPLAVAAGADFPYYLYELLVKDREFFPQEYKTEVYCRNLTGDMGWLISNFRADKNDPTLATLPALEVIKEIKSIITLKEKNDTFVLDDFKPGLMELLRLFSFLKNKVIYKIWSARISFQKFRVPQIRRKMSESKSVLFVCKGNICRSPFAEHYARKVLRIPTVESCGYYPQEGRKSPEEAIFVAREFGVDLSLHRSKMMTVELVRDARIIFVFDEENFKTVVDMFPFAKKKIFVLGILTAPNSPIIKDPYGKSVLEYRKAYASIKQTIDSLITEGESNA